MGSELMQAYPANINVPDSAPTHVQDCSDGIRKFDEQFHLVIFGTEIPIAHTRYRIVASTGEIFEGRTDSFGYTERVKTSYIASLSLEVFDSEVTEIIGDHV
jgi:uncharacterized protein (DUF2345 family)